MGLMETLDQCITAGHEMTKAIAIAQFNDDSPEARKITRRWRVGEAADLIGDEIVRCRKAKILQNRQSIAKNILETIVKSDDGDFPLFSAVEVRDCITY